MFVASIRGCKTTPSIAKACQGAGQSRLSHFVATRWRGGGHRTRTAAENTRLCHDRRYRRQPRSIFPGGATLLSGAASTPSNRSLLLGRSPTGSAIPHRHCAVTRSSRCIKSPLARPRRRHDARRRRRRLLVSVADHRIAAVAILAPAKWQPKPSKSNAWRIVSRTKI